MKSLLLKILHKPYPLEERKKAQIKLALLFGFVVFAIMYFVNPFGYNGSAKQLLANCIYAGLLTTSAICFDFLLLFPLFPQFFKEQKWTVGREIIFTIIIITSIASFNILAGKFLWGTAISFTNWLRMVFFTGVIGIAPATISILLNQARLLKKYRNEVVAINEQLLSVEVTDIKTETQVITTQLPIAQPTTVNELDTITHQTAHDAICQPTLITFTADNDKENVTINQQSFLAVTSADNYVKIYYIENGILKTKIIRSTLKKIEENNICDNNFFRCHRTAIVNLTTVKKVNGTAQGYKLKLNYMVDEVPVSRSLNKTLKQKLEMLNIV